MLTVILFVAAAAPADWPQFLGPGRTGVIRTDAKLARTWPAAGPKVLWTADVGAGFAAPAVADGQVYLLDRVGNSDVLRCWDLQTGKELWKASFEAPGQSRDKGYAGSRSTPAVDEKHVYAVGPFGGLYCVDRKTHQPVWRKNIVTDFAGKVPQWDVSQSPLLYKDWVLIAPQSGKAGVVALEKATGREVWRTESIGSMQYASPLLTTIGGAEQVVMLANVGKQTTIHGIDVKNGRILWKYDGWRCSIPVPSVTAIGDGRFYITGDYGAGCAMFQVTGAEGNFSAKTLWKNRNAGSHIHNGLLYEGHIYSNSSRDGKGLVCQALDGDVKWQTGRNPSFDLGGGLVIVNDLIYIIDGRGGTLHLVEASPQKYNELAQAKLLEGRNNWAPPVYTSGRLLIRDHQNLKVLDVTAD